MSNSDESAPNRYGFLKPAPVPAHRSTLSPLGVSSEFVHRIIDRVEKLIGNIEQTVKSPIGPSSQASASSESMKEQLESMKSESLEHKLKGITILKECVSLVDEQLNDTHHKLNSNLHR